MVSRSSDMVKLPKYVTEKDGRLYFRRVRKRGGKQKTTLHRLPDLGDPDFSVRYQSLLRDRPPTKHLPGSFNDLIAAYKASPEFKKLALNTRKNRLRYFAIISEKFGDYAYVSLHQAKVYEIRDEYHDTPGKADNLVQSLSALYSWAKKRRKVKHNPCEDVERLSVGEHDPWPDHVLEAALEAASPMLGLAIQVHYYTGQRIGDVCRMQWNHIRDGEIEVTQQKTGTTVWVPLHSDLAAALADMPRESLFLLYGRYKQPFKPDTLRGRLKRLMEEIGEDYQFHGLRKNAVNALLEAGCSEYEVWSITGQSTQTIAHYAKQVRKKKLAGAAILKWEKKNG